MRLTFFTFLVFLISLNSANAAHITGGELTVEYVEGNTFQAVLKLYRDCASNGAFFDQVVHITVFDAVTDEHFSELDFIFDGFSVEEPVLGDSCYTPGSAVCLEIGTYITEFDLPDNPNGYYLSKERCCRNDQPLNLEAPTGPSNDWGFVFTAEVADPALQNSTPVFGPYPTEAFLCVNTPKSFDFSATDIDGDSLVYSLSEPLNGNSTAFSPNPQVAAPRPYPTVPWAMGYGVNNQVGGSPSISIDPQTGLLSAQPDVQGVFTLAVKVGEYRNGEQIDEIRREIQISSTICVMCLASFSVEMNGLEVQFTDESTNPSSWSWDFGDGNTSNEQSPTHVYNAPGTYTVTLTTGNGAETSLEIAITAVGVAEFENSGFELMPNPANAELRIVNNNANTNPASLTIYDLSGRIVLQKDLSLSQNWKVNTSSIAIGNYILKMVGREGNVLYLQNIVISH